jgi:hypothetical protein
MRKLAILFALCLCFTLLATQAFAGAKITIINASPAGVGFNDPTPATPVGGNPGTTLGEQRLNVFKEAARVWGQNLDSPVDIFINATMQHLTCTATSAVLGSTGITTIFSDFGGDSVGFFPGPEFAATWYGSALADKRSGQDLNALYYGIAGYPDINMRFNSDIGMTGCLDGQFWYLGYDLNTPPNQINMLTTMLHEFAHGLNFSQFASVTSGAMISGLPDIYNRQIIDDTTGKTWDQMTDAERVASAINSRKVAWIGPEVTSFVPSVLSYGVPTLQVTAPAAIAGPYEVGQASFGAALTSTLISGKLVLALDPSDAAGASTNDGCSPLTNGSDVAGNIAVLTRGTCGFVIKVKNAQNAGAIAVVIADNAAGAPPAGLGGADPTITIPSVRVTLTDGNLIKAQLTGGATVTVSLGLDMSRIAGADANHRALLYTPNPVAPGSTISHYDDSAFPNQLMEYAINADLTHEVKPPKDLTLPLLHDVGWFLDADNDGVADASDQCAGSNLTPGAIVIGSCNTTVTNVLFSSGCTIRDLLANSANGVKNKGGYISNVAHLGNALFTAGVITMGQKNALQSCAASTK